MSIFLVFKNASWGLLNQLLSRGSLILVGVLLARFLSVDEYARFGYFQMTVNALAAYASVGLGVTAVKVASRAELEVRFREKIWTLFFISLVVSALFSALLLGVSLFNGGRAVVESLLLALAVFFISLVVVPTGVAVGFERFKKMAFASLYGSVVLLVGAAVASSFGSSVLGMFAVVLAAISQFIFVGKLVVQDARIERSLSFKLDFSIVREILGLSVPMFLVSLLSSSGVWVVGYLVLNEGGGALEFARFSIGLQWFSLGMLLPTQLSTAMMPRLVRFFSKDDGAPLGKKNDDHWRSVVICILSASFVCLIGFYFSGYANYIYGDEYSVGRGYLWLYLLAAVFGSVSAIVGNSLVALGRQFVWLGITLIWFVSMLVIVKSAWFSPEFAGGAALVIGQLVMAVFSVVALILYKKKY